MGYGRSSPAGTGATNEREIEITTGLGKAGEGVVDPRFRASRSASTASLCISSLTISSSESPRIPPPSVQRLLVSERHCGKGKRDTFT
jgi:hypothetical protein